MNDHPQKNNCVNCHQPGGGRFCQNCGQRLDLPRLSVKQFAGDIMDRVLGLEGMLPRTIKGLTTNPGQVIREYIKGNRKKYVNPVSYYFLLFAAYLLLLRILDIDMGEMVNASGVQNSVQDAMGNPEIDPDAQQKQQGVQSWIFDNIQFFALMMFPFVAWWLKVFFRKPGYNFLERIILPFYVFGHLAILSIFYALIFKFTGFYSTLLALFTTLVYFCWVGYTFYQPGKKVLGVLKMFMVYLLSYICFLLSAAILGVIIGLLT